MVRNYLDEIVPIKTDRCVIKLLEEDTIPWYAKTVYEPFFSEYIDCKANENTVENIKRTELALAKIIKEHKSIRLVVMFSNIPVGGITLEKTSNRRVYKLGYWVVPEHQSKGIAKETVKCVCQSFIESGVANRIVAEIQCKNTKSIALIKSIGFKSARETRGVYMKNIVYEMGKNSK